MSTISQAIAFAMKQRGIPYHWGGTTRAGGFDCSGLVWAAYRNAGYTGIGRTTYQQIKQGRAVPLNQLLPGDIVFTNNGEHEGLYIGHGRVLEAPHTGDVVKIVPASAFNIQAARRLVAGGGGVNPPRTAGGGIHPAGPAMVAQNMASIISHFTAQAAAQPLQQPGDVLSRLLPQPAASPPTTPQAQAAAAPDATQPQQETQQGISQLNTIRRGLLHL